MYYQIIQRLGWIKIILIEFNNNNNIIDRNISLENIVLIKHIFFLDSYKENNYKLFI